MDLVRRQLLIVGDFLIYNRSPDSSIVKDKKWKAKSSAKFGYSWAFQALNFKNFKNFKLHFVGAKFKSFFMFWILQAVFLKENIVLLEIFYFWRCNQFHLKKENRLKKLLRKEPAVQIFFLVALQLTIYGDSAMPIY